MATEVIDKIKECIDHKKSFILDAGAGSGKTYTLMQTIEYLSNKDLANNQQILCITFTNVAKDEILERLGINRDLPIIINTMHDFFWGFIKQFQVELRKEVKKLADKEIEKIKMEKADAQRKIDSGHKNVKVADRLVDIEKCNKKLKKYENIDYIKLTINYDLYKALYRGVISHDEVIEIAYQFLQNKNFFNIFYNSFPYILIDEYQDTDNRIINILFKNLKENPNRYVVGIYGDTMQQIYIDRENNIEFDHALVEKIPKLDNYRTNEKIVIANNILRADSLKQDCEKQDPLKSFDRLEFICNSSDDKDLKKYLGDEYESYKRLYLKNDLIAEEVGYLKIANVFNDRYPKNANEKLRKLEDPLIAYIINVVIVYINDFKNRHFSNLISQLNFSDERSLLITKGKIDELLKSEDIKIREIIDEFIELKLCKEKDFNSIIESYDYDSDDDFIIKLLEIPIKEFIALNRQLNLKTNLSTIHGVKGEEYDKVIVNLFENDTFKKKPEFFEKVLNISKRSSLASLAHKLLYVASTRVQTALIINYIVDGIDDLKKKTIEEWAIDNYGNDINFKLYEINVNGT